MNCLTMIPRESKHVAM